MFIKNRNCNTPNATPYYATVPQNDSVTLSVVTFGLLQWRWLV